MDSSDINNESNAKTPLELIEPLILFTALFLPAFFSQSREADGGMFNSPYFNLTYLTRALPQAALILYLIKIKGIGTLKKFGIKKIRLKDIPGGFLVLAGILLSIIPITIITSIIQSRTENFSDGIIWYIDRISILPLIFITCLATGYLEELFFRVYLITMLEKIGLQIKFVIPAAAFLFASGHIYQGISGFAVTFIIGIVLSFFFLKKRNIHRIAIGHALYNFLILLLTLLF